MTAIATDPAATTADLPAALPGRGSESRLRRGGLLRAAAGLAAATAVAGAQASIVYSGALNTQFNTLFVPVGSSGIVHQTTINIAPGQPLRLSARIDKGGYTMVLDSFSATFDPVSIGAATLQLFSGAGGDFIDGNDNYSLASSILSFGSISPGTTAYFGFRFTQGKSAQQLFGWGEFTYAPGDNWFMNGYAYEDSGAGILTGATGLAPAANGVPEPGTVPLVAAAGLAAAFFRRRGNGSSQPRQSTSASKRSQARSAGHQVEPAG